MGRYSIRYRRHPYGVGAGRAITCHSCWLTSWDPAAVDQRFCEKCDPVHNNPKPSNCAGWRGLTNNNP